VASAATVGSLMLPEMKQRGYSDTLSIGTVLSVGPIAILIPPSGMMVVYSGISNLPLDKLLIGGILPGVLLGVLTALFVVGWAIIDPKIAPAYAPEMLSIQTRLVSMAKAGLPLVFLIFCVVGTIYFGIATPTEAAAAGALAAFVLAAVYRKLTWRVILESLASTAKVSGTVLFIITGSVAYGQIFALTGASAGLVEFVRDLAMPAWLLVMVLIGVVLILGGPLDPISIMFITIPIFIPLVRQAGLDPLWFSILMMIAIEIAVISPPSGGNLFVLQAVAPKDIPTRVFYWATVPFMGVHVVGLIIVALVPALAVWLPSMTR
jgi:tripartite ATP-independent transporter DctM subunit